MSVIRDLEKQSGLFICSPCGHEFRLSEARLFDATKALPPEALEHLQAMRDGTAELKETLAKKKRNATEKAKATTVAVNVGKVAEKIAPSLPGFPARPDECRSLFEPIDYVVFVGLAKGSVDALQFVDVKTGNAKLGPAQREIRDVIEGGKVSLFVAPPAAKEEAA